MDREPPREGRGRGRGRGRARGRARGQPPPEDMRRPGEERAQQPVAQAQAARARDRAIRRESGQSIEALTGAISKVKVSSESAGPSTRRERQELPEPVTRPDHAKDKRGTTGRHIEIYSNYFRLLSRPNWRIYQYHVDFAPIVESSRMRRGLLHDHKELFGPCYLFDGMSDIKSLTKLNNVITEVYSKRRTDDENIQITIKRVAELAPNHPEVNRLFNTQMRRNLQHLGFLLLGRYFFDKSDVAEIPEHGIQLWRGVLTAIQERETGIMMAVDTIHKVLRMDTVLEQMRNIADRDQRNWKDSCIKEIVGAIVMTRYNNRTYRIEDIDWSKDPTHTFQMQSETISYINYYKKQYDITIRDLKQPLLMCKSKQKEIRSGKSNLIYLIPELCCMTGLTDEMRADFKVMRNISEHTRLDPATRVSNLIAFIQRIDTNAQIKKEMDGWGIKFSNELVKIDARVAVREEIFHKGGNIKSMYDPVTADFSKEMRGKEMFSSQNLMNWVVIISPKEESKANDFIQNLMRVCPPMGMKISDPQVLVIPDDRINSYLTTIRSISSQAQIIIIIVPNNRKDRYDAIKKLACVDIGVPTQVIVSRTLAKKQMLMSVATKIGIQLNCKLGGEPWAVDIPLKKPMMVIGFDTYHDSTHKGQSVGGFVASLNKNLTRWYSQISFHQSGGWHEMSDRMGVHLTNALKEFYKINKVLPEIIFFYRDGVSNGQVNHVKDYELSQLKSAINSIYDKEIRFAFIIVNKRISTRFFKFEEGKMGNPLPGTIIDSEVTRPTRYDFFLVSQSVRQGTVSPTQYNVIHDTSGFPPDKVQILSYKLTHLYFNWPGTIRVPAPCQYAHKLAYLTGQSLHQDCSNSLDKTLFYL